MFGMSQLGRDHSRFNLYFRVGIVLTILILAGVFGALAKPRLLGIVLLLVGGVCFLVIFLQRFDKSITPACRRKGNTAQACYRDYSQVNARSGRQTVHCTSARTHKKQRYLQCNDLCKLPWRPDQIFCWERQQVWNEC